jgi:hypothetical protein
MPISIRGEAQAHLRAPWQGPLLILIFIRGGISLNVSASKNKKKAGNTQSSANTNGAGPSGISLVDKPP